MLGNNVSVATRIEVLVHSLPVGSQHRRCDRRSQRSIIWVGAKFEKMQVVFGQFKTPFARDEALEGRFTLLFTDVFRGA